MHLLKLLLFGPGPPDWIPRQGCRYLGHVIRSEWRKERFFGVVRLLRLLLQGASALFPIVLLDSIEDWVIQKCSRQPQRLRVDARLVAIYRECYFLARAVFLLCTLILGWYTAHWATVLTGYFILEVTHAWLGRAVAWGNRSIHPARSLVLAILNYAEVTVAFSILYLNCRCLSRPVSGPEAVYFSLVTAATVGFGDIYPKGRGQYFVMWQIVVFLVFVVFVVSTLVSQLPGQTRRTHWRHNGVE
jgi:hypothetical protein